MLASWLNGATFSDLLSSGGLFFVALTVIGIVGGFAHERLAWKRNRRIFAIPLKRDQVKKELLGTVVFLALFVPSIAFAVSSHAIRFGGGVAAEVATFVVAWVGFQAFYWFLHRAMHTRALFFAHKWHHESLVTTPVTGFSMSPLEAVGWVVGYLVFPILLTLVWEVGAWGLAVFFFFHFYGNIAGHANAEFLPDFFGRRAVSLSGNPVCFHSLHHARFDGHYGFGAAWMDRLMGTEFEDWQAIHAKVISGHPLKSLREKG